MRNKSYIKKILKEVETIWNKNKSLRLGQLLWYLAGKDPFYTEDKEWINLWLEKEENEKKV